MKSIDKMFEEAVSSGVLTLRERKLKEFPVHFCGRFDLSDLISAGSLLGNFSSRKFHLKTELEMDSLGSSPTESTQLFWKENWRQLLFLPFF